MKMQAWKVTVRNSFGGHMPFTCPINGIDVYYDIVYFDHDMTLNDVKRSLIDHDNYPGNIWIDRLKD